jgi:hypothetical protein
MVPVHRPGVEADPAAALLQPPAQVDVVAGGAVARIEAADRGERVAAKRHVAAGNVLGFAIGHEHVDRSAGRVGDALGDRPVAGGRDVGPADADAIPANAKAR